MLGYTSKKLEVSDSFLGLKEVLPEDISAQVELHAGERSLEKLQKNPEKNL